MLRNIRKLDETNLLYKNEEFIKLSKEVGNRQIFFILDVLNKSLNKLGFDVLLAKNGKEGISIYKKNIDKVKLIILDVNMPELSGKETFDKLKSLNKKCKILIATGFTLNEEVQELLDMGADGYIKKPFDLLTLSQKIGEIWIQENDISCTSRGRFLCYGRPHRAGPFSAPCCSCCGRGCPCCSSTS